MARSFIRWAESLQADVIVTTHFFPGDVLAAARRAGRLRGRLVIVITDVFPHQLWLAREADEVVVATEETRAHCERRGVPADRLRVLGIPIDARFRPPADRVALARTLGLDPERRTVLVMSGGMGIGPIEEVVGRLLRLDHQAASTLQIVVVCGQNERLLARIRDLAKQSPVPVTPLGMASNMHELMGVSDVLVTKPGGLTVTEALAVGLPMVFCGAIPGQERFNAAHAVRGGAALDGRDARGAVEAAARLLAHPEALSAMRQHARDLGRPSAAEELVRRCIVPPPAGSRPTAGWPRRGPASGGPTGGGIVGGGHEAQ